MDYVVILNEQTLQVLKSIVSQVENSKLIATPVPKTKKLSKEEEAIQNMKNRYAQKPKRNR